MATQTNTVESASGDIIQLRILGTNDVVIEESSAAEGNMLNSAQENGIHSENPPATEAKEYPTGLKFWLIILNMSAFLVLGGLDTNIVATAVPSITDHFHTVADVGWYSSAFRLCCCAFQFIFGKLYSLFSVKYTFLFANAIFLLGSLLCSTASTSIMFVAGRAVTGVGFAGIIGGIFIILTHVLPLRRRPFFCGIMGGIESASVISAPIIGGVLTQSLGWRWCFWINLPIGCATFLMTIFLFPDPKPSDKSIGFKQKMMEIDPLSNLLFIPALTTLFIALSWAGVKYPWADGKVVGLLVTFVALIAAFFCNQYRKGNTAALPPRIMKNRSVIGGIIFTMCTNSAINVIEYYLPTYYQIVREYSPSDSGYMMAPIVIGSCVGMLLCGSGTSTLGYYAPFMLLSSVAMPVFAGLVTTFGINTSFSQLILYSGASGFASGIGFNAPMTAVQTVLHSDDVSLGLSVMLFAQHFGPAVSIAMAQVIFTSELSSNLAQAVPGLHPVTIESNGLTDIISRAPASQRMDLLRGVGKSLSETWYLAVGLTCVTLIGSLLMEWRSVKKKYA